MYKYCFTKLVIKAGIPILPLVIWLSILTHDFFILVFLLFIIFSLSFLLFFVETILGKDLEDAYEFYFKRDKN